MYDFSVQDAFGILGVGVYLFAYSALQLGFVQGRGYVYAALNTVAAVLVLLSLQDKFNLSSALIQVSWIVISVIGIIRFYILTHRSRFSEEERVFLDATMPGLGAIHARRLLNLGSWHTKEAGTRLTEHGKKNEHLYFLQTGGAGILVDGKTIARLEGGTFIGELTLMTGDPASATVELDQTTRYLAIPVAPLHHLMERDSDVRQHLKAALSSHVVDKLVRSNRDMVGLAPA